MTDTIIIGGGIGGLTCAVAMAQRGFNVRVFEKTPQLQPVGAGLGLGINAMRVLRKLNIADEVIKRGNRLQIMYIKTPAGKILNRVDIRPLIEKFAVPAITIHRADLHDILVAALPKNTLQLGEEFVAYEQQDSQVMATFASGRQAAGQLLVGSDGIHSQVRKQMHGKQPLRDAQQMCWRGICEGENIDAPHYCVVWGREARFGFVRVNAKQIYWFCTINKGHGEIPVGKEQLLGVFQKWCKPVPQILSSTEESAILRNDLFDRVSSKSWYENRVVLLGDSIHPTTPNLGQGACMAIESAEVLAHCLEYHKDIAIALKDYQALRLPRTRQITTASWRVGKIATIRNLVLMHLRNTFVRVTPSMFPRRRLQQVFAYNIY
ncbi:FAD-dependent monooxygenase [Candidatus Uabimicrobium amorphum]|uniref:FAD-binding domain-containing protein n=1 Tax=Uabimicrobium amorphum TaxID=2596890 RepID=A0A5S9IQC9_UABAM|nr:FAD-dependent monooxygenase [Candidatus Uabimicrobium amorphum]BBM85522.1 hypothetical protein UABAM_03891 [Candidatus Uabimicrobium amorphum]